MPPKNYSSEQQEIIHCSADVVVAQAFAGTGKSTTAIGYAAHHKNDSVLVLCFNNANAVEGRNRYDRNDQLSGRIQILTTHALALRYLPQALSNRLSDRWNSVTLRSELKHIGARSDIRTAAITMDILNDFFSSPEAHIDPAIHGGTAIKNRGASVHMLNECAEYAERLWKAMNSEDGEGLSYLQSRDSLYEISIPHDAYLKRFVMESRNLGYDRIVFDEAQDANRIMLKLIDDQMKQGSKTLYLGDEHQSIYGYRGAVNAMKSLPEGAVTLPLTQSYRFGARVAAVANLILSELKGETLRIQGMGQDELFEPGGKLTFLSRTNAGLIARAVSADPSERIHWVGGIEGYRISILNDAWALRQGKIKDIQDPFIRRNFRGWDEFKEAAKVDNETAIIMNIVEEYMNYIPQLVRGLHQNAVVDPNEASLTLSTGHKSKGLEWDHVSMGSDLRSSPFMDAEQWLQGNNSISFPEQELNLQYVMATRARKEILINRPLKEWIKELPELRERRTRNFAEQESAQSSSDSNTRSSAQRAGPAMSPHLSTPNRSPFAPVGRFRSAG